MTFTTFLYQLIVASLILPTVNLFSSAILFPEDPVYLSATVFGFAIALLIHENILTFFTIQKVFLTRILTMTLLGMGFLSIADATIPGVKIMDIDVLRDLLSGIVIGEQEISKYVTMLLVSLICGIVFYILKKLKSN
jgi:hypothetical protein